MEVKKTVSCMKQKWKGSITGLCLGVLLFLALGTGIVLAHIYFSVPQDDPLGAFPFDTVICSYGTEKTNVSGFTYNDGMLLRDADTIYQDMAKASVVLACSAYQRDEIKSALSEDGMGFTNITQYNYSRKSSMFDNDFVAYSIASKMITYQGQEYIVYCVPVRGTPGSAEWFSNFNLGTSGNHTGFYRAANDILTSLKDLMNKDGYSPDRRIVWTMGHSRGAAVANIIAGEFTCSSEYSRYADANHVFGYTYACPAVSKYADVSCSNIYNFNNPGDLIPELPKSEWGYKRYGQTRELDLSDLDNVSRRFETVYKEQYRSLTSTDSYLTALSELIVNEQDFYSADNKMIITFAAYVLGGKNSVSMADLMLYLGYQESDYIMKKLGEQAFPGVSELCKQMEDVLKKAKECKLFIEQGLSDTLNMSDEEFAEWAAEHKQVIEEIESDYFLNIESRSDLLTAMLVLDEAMATAVQVARVVEDVVKMFCDTDGKPLDSITHGHTTETYVLWINSMYFGYEGWIDSKDLKRVSIPEELMDIGRDCFKNCELLEAAYIPETVKYIASGAFDSCVSLTEIKIPNYVMGMGYGAFGDCSGIKKVTIPVDYEYTTMPIYNCPGVEEIRYTAGRTGIMPDRVTESGKANNYVYTLEYQVRETLVKVSYEEGIKRIGANAYNRTIGNGLSKAKLAEVALPLTLESVGDRAFYEQSAITAIKQPEGEAVGLTGLGEGSFYGCAGLKSLEDIGGIKKVEVIPRECFANCTGLTDDLEIQDGMKLESGAFAGCSGIKKVTIPVDYEYTTMPIYNCPGVEEIRYTAGRTGIMPDRVTESGKANNYVYTLEYQVRKTLVKVSYEEGIKRIGANAYNRTIGNGLSKAKLAEVALPLTLESVGDRAFYEQSAITAIKQPEGEAAGLTGLGEGSFYGCAGLKSLEDIGGIKKVEVIPRECFANCTGLTDDLEIQDGMKLESGAFAGCSGIKKVTIPVDYEYTTMPIYNCPGVEEIRYTAGRTGIMPDRVTESGKANNYVYTLEYQVRETLVKVSYEEGIKRIGANAYNRTIGNGLSKAKLAEVALPLTLESVGDRAFYEQSAITAIKQPEGEAVGLTGLGEGSFYGCAGLKSLEDIGGIKKVEVIPRECFANCTGLTDDLEIQDGMKLESGAFAGCSGIKKVTIPVDYEYTTMPIYNCPGVEEIRYTAGRTGIMPDRVTESGKANNYVYTLEYQVRETLVKVSYEEGIKRIGANAYNRTIGNGLSKAKLAEVALPLTLESVGDRAFYEQSAITAIKQPEGEAVGLTGLGEGSFYGCAGLKSLEDIGGIKKVEVIPRECFANCTGLTDDLEIQDGMKLESGAFAGCSGIKKVTIPVDYEYTTMPIYNCPGVEEIRYTAGRTGIMPDRVTESGKANNYVYTLEYQVRKTLVKVSYEEGIKRIGANAYNRTIGNGLSKAKLAEVALPLTLESVGDRAFYEQSAITAIKQPEGEAAGLTGLGEGSFYGCAGLKSLEDIGGIKKVEVIPRECFANCTGLTDDLEIQDGMKLESGAFAGCSGIKKVTIPVDYEYTTMPIYNCPGVEEIRYTAGRTGIMPDRVTESGKANNYVYTLEYQVRETLVKVSYEEGIKRIGANAYNRTIGNGLSKAKLAEVALPLTLESVGDRAFYEQSAITAIKQPEGEAVGLTGLGEGSFYGCAGLKSLEDIGGIKKVEVIPRECFANCTGLTDDLEIQDGMKLESGAFAGCSGIKKVTIPVDYEYTTMPIYNCPGVEEIRYTAGRTGIMPDRVTESGKANNYVYTLEYQVRETLVKVSYEEGIKRIGANAYNRTIGNGLSKAKLAEVGLPLTLESVGDQAFYSQSAITAIHLPDTITSIGAYAFNGCSGFDKMIIPYSVSSIGNYAFGNASTIYNLSNVELNDSSAKEGEVRQITIHYNVHSNGESIKEDYVRKCFTREQAETLGVLDKTDYYMFPTDYDDLEKYEGVKWYTDSDYKHSSALGETAEITEDILYYATNKKVLSNEDITIELKVGEGNSFIYTGMPAEYQLSLYDNGDLLTDQVDYEAVIVSQDGTDEETGAATSAGIQNGMVTIEIAALDSGRYRGTLQTRFEIQKAETAPNLPEDRMDVPYHMESLDDITLPTDWIWTDADVILEVGEETFVTAEYNGADKGNYITETVEIVVQRQVCQHDREIERQMAADPSCTEPGYTGDAYCADCGELLSFGEEIPALGHQYTDYISDNNASCTQDGTKTAACSHNGCTETDTVTDEGSMLSHTIDEGTVTKEPTEEEEGIRVYHCSVCGQKLREEVIDKLTESHTHDFAGDYLADEYGHWQLCDCGAASQLEDHIWDAGAVMEMASCTKSGTMLYTCEVCGKTKEERISALGHQFTDYISNNNASCTQDGTKTAACSHNGCTETDTVTDEGSMLSHTIDEGTVIKEPTKEEEGIRAYHCSVCGQKLREEVIDKLAESHTHKFAGDYLADEYGHWQVCGCGAASQLEDHIWDVGAVVHKASCTKPGTRLYTCEVCGKTKEEQIAAAGHQGGTATCTAKAVCDTCSLEYGKTDASHHAGGTEIRNAKSPTAAEDGYTGDTYCKGCGTLLKKGEVIKAAGTKPSDDTENDTKIPPAQGTVKNDGRTGSKVKVTNPGRLVNNQVIGTEVQYMGTSSTAGTITIPASVEIEGISYKITSIAANAFKNNKYVKKIIIGSNVKTIPANAFYGCKKLKTVTIGKNVVNIGDKAFYKCTALTKVTIPKKVAKIGKNAFYGCSKLKTITIKSAVLKRIGKSAIKGIHKKASVKVPKKQYSKYKKLLKSSTGYKRTMKIKKG